MRLDGRRESTNVDDRRGRRTVAKAGGLGLQADFLAGVWALHDNKMFGSLEDGDIDEGMAVASKIGDDYLQKQAYGYTVPDAFNHGTSAQRSRWLKKGIATGDISQGDTFSVNYNSL